MEKEKLFRIGQLYFSSAIIYGLAILLFRYLPYYQKTLLYATQKTLLYLYLTYLILAPVVYVLFATKESENKPLLLFRGIKRIFTQDQIEEKEKVAVLFILVKLFFLPTMTNFFFDNFKSLLIYKFHWYTFALTLIFTLDTLIFSIGYAVESRKLNNIVKSVEPTLFGWIVALISYPPFNSWIGNYIPWGANDYVQFWNPTFDTIIKLVIILLLIIYVWATIALGTKASNLTNRGIVSRFPYSIVRHPAYISKNLMWWLTLLPVINWKFALGMLFWTIIYYFRAITEEKHLLRDEDYVEYCKKVKWRFIPFLR